MVCLTDIKVYMYACRLVFINFNSNWKKNAEWGNISFASLRKELLSLH